MTYAGLQGRVYRMLQNVEWTRERRNKDRAIVRLLMPINAKLDETPWEMTTEKAIDFIRDANSADRYWRLLTAHHKELRGSDYDTKPIVEQRKELSLGYEPGYHSLRKIAV